MIDPSAGLSPAIDYSVRVAPDLLGAAHGYLEKRKAELGKMSSALEMSDFKALTKFARNMRTMAPSFGFFLLAEIGGRLEA